MNRVTAFLKARKAFFVKAVLALAVMTSGGSYLIDRFTFGADTARNRCLADYRTFLVDHHEHDVARDDLVAFHAQGIEPIFENGTLIAKYVRGVPGDVVEITQDHDVVINGKVIESGLSYAYGVNLDPQDLIGRMVIPEGEFWVMGDTDHSFDSRYWGTITHEQISGKAHGLF
ncbi:signal peptidase I [Vreelandella massiliensis]|uniref:signal peptidase I n=1 Tax=Vreelandella massiliensis TaxID=1816686 RepID=UPI00096A44A5|nr:signal peptidase I [Halomonas massiliensis]